MTLSAAKGVGLQATATGSLSNIPVSINGRVATGTKAVNLVISASNVNVGTIVRQLFSNDQLPDFLLAIVDPIKFSAITITYNSAASGKTKFGLQAVPDINGAPALKTVITAMGLEPTDLALRMGPSSLEFGVSKSYKVDLPEPFTGPGYASFSLAFDSASKGAVLSGSFAAGVRINGVRDPVQFSVAASVATSASNGVSLGLAGASLTPIVIDGFSFIQIGNLSLAASITPSPLVVNQLTLVSGQTMLLVVSNIMLNNFPCRRLACCTC